jgi:hypothetical protein
MKRIVLILSSLLVLFVTVTVIHSAISFRLAGPVVMIRLILGLASFILGGAWILLSLLAIPRALLAIWRSRNQSPSDFRWGLGALAAGMAPVILIGVLMVAAPRWCLVRMPGQTYEGPMPPLTPEQTELRERLRAHIEHLAVDIGDRSAATHYRQNREAADYIANAFSNAGYVVSRQAFHPEHRSLGGKPCENIAVEIKGSTVPEEIIVIGAHYDTAMGTPGANDNASGVAATIELARLFAARPCRRTLRFVAFANEEPPFFWTRDMGSMAYAAGCQARGEKITAMLSLETIGCFMDQPKSQHYPTKILEWFYPRTGNFIGFIGNTTSGWLVHDTVASFRKHARFPSQGAALPAVISGVGWSDHWSFWQYGYDAIEITDTAPFRYRYYHDSRDLPEHINFDPYAYVVSNLEPVITDLANP